MHTGLTLSSRRAKKTSREEDERKEEGGNLKLHGLCVGVPVELHAHLSQLEDAHLRLIHAGGSNELSISSRLDPERGLRKAEVLDQLDPVAPGYSLLASSQSS